MPRICQKLHAVSASSSGAVASAPAEQLQWISRCDATPLIVLQLQLPTESLNVPEGLQLELNAGLTDVARFEKSTWGQR